MGGVTPSLPSSSDCPLEFRAGVLVTANMHMGLAGRWGFLPLSRAVKPRAVSLLGEVIKERSNVFLNGTILGV